MNSNSRIIRHCIALMTIVAVAFTTTHAAQPNIVFFLIDDLGYMDIGANNPKSFYPTPNIDRLALEGMRFTDGYSACNVCSPTRAALMTGKYPARLNITDWLPGRGDKPDQKLKVPKLADGLALAEVTIAESLREGGYRTAIVGKWHLGENAFRPELQGFEVNIGAGSKGHSPSYFSPYRLAEMKDGPNGEFLTERLTDEALKFVDESVGAKKPFFLYFPHYTVHTPLQARTNRIEEFKRRAAALTNSVPDFAQDLGRRVRQIQNHATYAAMMESLDESVGRVTAHLKSLGIESNTIVIFTSDNGGLSTAEGTPTSNVPLRMGKGWPHEGGVRVPLIVKWPGVTRSGSTNNTPVITMDFYPTFLEAAGFEPKPKLLLDGVSLVSALRGEALKPRTLFWHYPHYSNQGGAPHGAMRQGDWKLIEWFEDDRMELFNLAEDVGERNDLADKNPGLTTKLKGELHAWRKATGAQLPTTKNNSKTEGK